MNRFYNDFKAIAIVDISKLRYNIENILSALNGTKFFAVVKSDAYGHGLDISQYIDKYCDGFCVSKLYEGQSLRYMGIKKPIMMLSPITGYDLVVAINYDLIVPCYDLSSANEIFSLANNRKIMVNIAVDSGMRRLGFSDIDTFEKVLKKFSQNKNIVLYSVYSHLKNSADDASNYRQLTEFERFDKIFKKYSDGFSHISASGGLIKGYYKDCVRCGILMYGYKPFDCSFDVKPIMKIVAKPSIIKDFKQNDICLYNSMIDEGKFGLVDYGYSDGLFRDNKPIRCMDLSYEKIDENGKCVILEDAQLLADKYGTIPYEILTNSTKRIKKIYINDL